MKQKLRALTAAGALAGILCAAVPTAAQKSGGVLKVYFFDSPQHVDPRRGDDSRARADDGRL
jgi:hypothetical protein